jgi:hypothetical protein
MTILTWEKCNDSKWCTFERVNLAHDHFTGMAGVYVIWHAGPNPKTVRVGQGNIADRIAAHRRDPQIMMYATHCLFVTWAKVPAVHHNGIEAYLAAKLDPIVGQRFPDVAFIEVNLPW